MSHNVALIMKQTKTFGQGGTSSNVQCHPTIFDQEMNKKIAGGEGTSHKVALILNPTLNCGEVVERTMGQLIKQALISFAWCMMISVTHKSVRLGLQRTDCISTAVLTAVLKVRRSKFPFLLI